MTRETKIGLLVGLAFIIVIGILLSHQLEQSTEPPSAQIAVVGPNVRNGVTVLGATQRQNTPITAPNVSPDSTVPTPGDLSHKPATAIVKVGPARDASQRALARRMSVAPADDGGDESSPSTGAAQPSRSGMMLREDAAGPTDASDSNTQGNTPPPTPARGTRGQSQVASQGDGQAAQNTGSDDPRVRAAREHGEEVLYLGHAQGSTGAAAQNQHAPGKTYKAQPGDSLSRIAAKFFGQDSPAAEEAIIHVNPSLESNRNLIIAGRNYNIPGAVKSPVAAPSDQASDAGQAGADSSDQGDEDASTPQSHLAQPVAASSEHFYVVKKGDTLWGIAASQLGAGSAVAAIEDLNKDLLKGGTTVREGMKLRLPAKSVASAE